MRRPRCQEGGEGGREVGHGGGGGSWSCGVGDGLSRLGLQTGAAGVLASARRTGSSWTFSIDSDGHHHRTTAMNITLLARRLPRASLATLRFRALRAPRGFATISGDLRWRLLLSVRPLHD